VPLACGLRHGTLNVPPRCFRRGSTLQHIFRVWACANYHLVQMRSLPGQSASCFGKPINCCPKAGLCFRGGMSRRRPSCLGSYQGVIDTGRTVSYTCKRSPYAGSRHIYQHDSPRCSSVGAREGVCVCVTIVSSHLPIRSSPASRTHFLIHKLDARLHFP